MATIRFVCTDKGQHGSRVLADIAANQHGGYEMPPRETRRGDRPRGDQDHAFSPSDPQRPEAAGAAPHRLLCPSCGRDVPIGPALLLKLTRGFQAAGAFDNEAQRVAVDVSALPASLTRS